MLLKRVVSPTRQSCIVLTAREKPEELGLYESSTGPVRTLLVEGLDVAGSKMILAEKDIHGEESTCSALARPYGVEIQTIKAHRGAIWGMAMCGDGRLVAGGVRGGAVQLWDASTGAAVGALPPDRLYGRMDITGLKGLTEAQKAALRSLGAIEQA